MTFQNLSSTLWRISRCFHHMLSCSQTCHRGCSTHIRGYGWSVLHVTYTSETTWATYALKHSHRHQRPGVETPLTHTHFRDHERWTGHLSHTYTHFRDQSEKLSSFHTHTHTHSNAQPSHQRPWLDIWKLSHKHLQPTQETISETLINLDPDTPAKLTSFFRCFIIPYNLQYGSTNLST